MQMNLNMDNCWGIVRALVDLCVEKLETDGAGVVLFSFFLLAEAGRYVHGVRDAAVSLPVACCCAMCCPAGALCPLCLLVAVEPC